MEQAAAGNQAQRLFDMAPSSDAAAEAVANGAGASEAAPNTFTPQSLFVTPTSAADTAAAPQGTSTVTAHPPAPTAAQEQQLQLRPCPAPVQEQRTIFVAGFPVDMTEREFHLLLTFLPGYEACQLGWGTGSPQGFALFRCNADAVAAVDRLAGHQVEVGSVLRAELAHKNLVIKKDLPAAVNGTQLCLLNNIQARTEALLSPGLGLQFANAGAVLHNPAQPVLMHPGYNGVMQPAAAAAAGLNSNPGLLTQNWRALCNARDNAPCNTLFIGNLGESTREEELHQLMASQAGFRQLKWSPTDKGVIAFVEFDDVTTATYVHSALQGVVLPSNDRGGLRIQFSKNPLGKRSPVDSAPNLHGLFAAPNPVVSTGIQPSALYNVALANPVGLQTLAPTGSYLTPMDMPTVSHQAAATAAAMAAVAATQGMANNTPLFGPVGTMLL